MNISVELKAQLDRFSRTRSFNINHKLKQELADWYQTTLKKTLNIKCGTCIRNAMNDLLGHSIGSDPAIKAKPQITFIGVKQKQLDDMTYRELKDLAKARGIIGNFKREKLIEELTNG